MVERFFIFSTLKMLSPDSEFEEAVRINTENFTDTEKEIILQVVARDEQIRIQEKSRIE